MRPFFTSKFLLPIHLTIKDTHISTETLTNTINNKQMLHPPIKLKTPCGSQHLPFIPKNCPFLSQNVSLTTTHKFPNHPTPPWGVTLWRRRRDLKRGQQCRHLLFDGLPVTGGFVICPPRGLRALSSAYIYFLYRRGTKQGKYNSKQHR